MIKNKTFVKYLVKRQKEFKKLYNGTGLIDITPNTIQMNKKTFFKLFTEFDASSWSYEYLKASYTIDGVEFFTLIDIN